jgi:hypothetical protein
VQNGTEVKFEHHPDGMATVVAESRNSNKSFMPPFVCRIVKVKLGVTVDDSFSPTQKLAGLP